MDLTRRAFGMTVIGAAALPGATVLDAVHGSHLPERLVLGPKAGIQPGDSRWFELRVYENCTRGLLTLLRRGGIQPLLLESSGPQAALLIPWPSLAGRERTWTELQCGEDWRRLRAQVSKIAIYRAGAGPHRPVFGNHGTNTDVTR